MATKNIKKERKSSVKKDKKSKTKKDNKNTTTTTTVDTTKKSSVIQSTYGKYTGSYTGYSYNWDKKIDTYKYDKYDDKFSNEDIDKFIAYSTLTQEDLFIKLKSELLNIYRKDVFFIGGKFIIAKGSKVGLVAHLDTVFTNPPQKEDIMISPSGYIKNATDGIGGDDRCGVYMIMSLLTKLKELPTVIFTCDEEIGAIGASGLTKALDNQNNLQDLAFVYGLHCLIEFDRKGDNDAVFYEETNSKFIDKITSFGYVEDYGSFSDISIIAPALQIASVNLSSSYYNPHSSNEYVSMKRMTYNINRAHDLIETLLEDNISYERVEYVSKYKTNYTTKSSAGYTYSRNNANTTYPTLRCDNDVLDYIYEDENKYTREELSNLGFYSAGADLYMMECTYCGRYDYDNLLSYDEVEEMITYSDPMICECCNDKLNK